MKSKNVLTCTVFVFSLICLGAGNAGSLNGGDAATAEAADTFVDIVFAIDNSGSMGDEAASISDNVQAAIENLQCPNIDVWVNARFMGITGTWGGTLFDEVATTILSNAGDSTTINSSEDNGPVVYDFSIAQNYWQGAATGTQAYQKAVVTIGDEGLQNGSPVNQDDYDVGKEANDEAIGNDTLVFSIIGNSPSTGAAELFTALAEGGVELGGHQFNPTGGFAVDSTDENLQTRLEEVFCTAGTGGNSVSAQPIPTLSQWTLAFLAMLLAYLGYLGMRRRQG